MSMLNWICPECGHEVPAADPECPACTGAIPQQLPLPLVIDPPPAEKPQPAEPASRTASVASLPDHLSEPEHSAAPTASADEPQPAEPATEPTLDPISRTASVATGTERHSPADHLCDPEHSGPLSDSSAPTQLPAAPVEARPTDGTLQGQATAPVEEAQTSEPISQPSPAEELHPQPVAASVEASSADTLDVLPPHAEEPILPLSEPVVEAPVAASLDSLPLDQAPQTAEPASEPQLGQVGRTASEVTGPEQHSLAEPLCEAEHSVPAAATPSLTDEPQSLAASVEEPEGTLQGQDVASVEESRIPEPISEPSLADPQPVAASSTDTLDVLPPHAEESVLPLTEPVVEAPLALAQPAAAPPPEIDPAHYGAVGSAYTALAENILESIPSQPVSRIVESFQAAPPAPLLPAGEPFPEPSSRQAVFARPNITVRGLAPRPLLGKPEPLVFAQVGGPLLPAELSGRPSAAPPADPRPIPKRRQVPAWVITPVVVVLSFIAAHIWLQSSGAAGEAKPVAAAPPVAAPLSPGGASAVATSPEGWPFAHYIEVTGIRVVADLNHHSHLHYIVVNHSAADLSDVSLHIGVHSAADVSKTLFRVKAVVPSLGPFASKEITIDLDTQMRASEIPEWELLRVDVQAGPR